MIFPIISPWMMYAPSLAICYFQGDAYWKWYAVALYIGDVYINVFGGKIIK